MGGLVSPVIQVPKIRNPSRSGGVGGLQIEQEAEAVEVSLDIVVAGIPLLKGQVRGELSLGRRLERGGNRADPDLRAFGIEIAAEALEVGAEVRHKAPERLVEERGVRRGGCEDRGAVGIHPV
jgi:hypothetical protein